MRVIYVLPGSSEGKEWSLVFVKRQIVSLENLGIEAKIFYFHTRYSIVGFLQEIGRLRRALRSFSPDLVHAQFGSLTAFGSAISSTLPLVISFRGSDLNPAASDSDIRNFLTQLLSQFSTIKASAVICVSNQLKDRLLLQKIPIFVIPSGVDISLFKPRSKLEARNLLGWSHDERVVLFANRDPVGKGFDLAKQAIGICRQHLPQARLHLLDGKTSPREIPIIMNASDALLLASMSEGSPNIVKEAIASSLPVVSVDVGDVRERLEGVFPSQITSRNPIEMACALLEILKSPQSSNGHERAKTISLEAIAEKIVSVYNLVLMKNQG